VADLESYHGVDIEVRDREAVEQTPGDVLDDAQTRDVVFLTAGDTMIATTHVDLRLRAHERGIETRVVHGTTAQAAASGLTGLQNYRFGKATTLPFERSHGGEGVPDSVRETIKANRKRGLHSLVFLDIDADREAYMRGDDAAGRLVEAWRDDLGVVIARAGSPNPVVQADLLSTLATASFDDPLHLLVVPGDLHHIERDALVELGGAPERALADR
jgi:diphthine synthase